MNKKSSLIKALETIESLPVKNKQTDIKEEYAYYIHGYTVARFKVLSQIAGKIVGFSVRHIDEIFIRDADEVYWTEERAIEVLKEFLKLEKVRIDKQYKYDLKLIAECLEKPEVYD